MARRRRRGTWFPIIGTAIGESQDVLAGREFILTVDPSGSIRTIITELTFDRPREGEIDGETSSLADIIGSEYVMQRIVGKLFMHRQSTFTGVDEDIDVNPAIIVSAGFFVARANDESVGGGAATPIGSATEGERRDNYSPLEVDTTREPWIWRRTWVLGAAGGADQAITTAAAPTARVSQPTNAAYPKSTPLYGSVWDEPHIDSKVARKVAQDNRLWFAVSASTFPAGSGIDPLTDVSIVGYLDYRLFGRLVKARQTSAF